MSTDQPADVDTRAAWSWNSQKLALIVAASVGLLALIALVSVIDLPDLGRDSQQRAQDAAADQQNTGGLGPGLDGGGRVDLGDGTELDLRPIPGCPGGFQIGEDILVIPDPEACGYRPIPPGAQGFEPSGKTILVPSLDGEIGGFRLGPDGDISFLAPGDVRGDDLVVSQYSDGTFGLFRADGSWIEISPGDDGLSLRDPTNGDSLFVPGDGNGEPFDTGSLFDNEPGAQDNPLNVDEPASRNTNPSSSDATFLWILLALLVVGIVAFAAIAMSGATVGSDDKDDPDDGDDESPHDPQVDYSAELNALDRMLWEIDQEPDPRTAIRRVYAALETGLDNPEMARRRVETPGIYLRRVLGRFDELQAPLRELTDLFEQARFSEHEITTDMRDRAVYALLAVRGHYAHAASQAMLDSTAS